MSLRATRVGLAILLTSALAPVAAGCGLDSSVVGGRCRDGLVLDNGACVPPTPELTLITPTDPPLDTPTDDASAPSGSSLLGTVDNPGLVVIPPAPSATVDPNLPPVLPPITPAGPTCVAPLVLCRGKCIDVSSDPQNCGACGKVCPSNICVAFECQGATPGDVVLIGHDYAKATPGSSQAKVLANALTIPTTEPIRVLSFEDGASSDALAQVLAITGSDLRGRTVNITRAAAASELASAKLSQSYDVVLIHDASGVDPATTGASWSSALGGFTAKGGVVVALDRGSSPMPQLLTASGLLAVTSHTTLPSSTHLLVTGALDVIGAQVLAPYAAFGSPVSFLVPPQDANLTWVVRAQRGNGSAGAPVVIHRVVR
jgi:ferredoxin